MAGRGTPAFKQQKASQFETRKSAYSHTWPWCVSYNTRKRALYNDMTRYVCCNGDCPCSGRMNEQSCPEFCLCAEVFFCFTQSVASTRWMLQDEMHISNTQCDNCLIGTMIFCQYLACLCDIAACISGSDEIRLLADAIDLFAQAIWCSVCACMQTQHKVQIDERDKNPGIVRPPMNPYIAPAPQAIPPPNQQGPFPPYGPPQAGYQQGYGQQGGYNQGANYPPAGYPQQGGYQDRMGMQPPYGGQPQYPGPATGYPADQNMKR